MNHPDFHDTQVRVVAQFFVLARMSLRRREDFGNQAGRRAEKAVKNLDLIGPVDSQIGRAADEGFLADEETEVGIVNGDFCLVDLTIEEAIQAAKDFRMAKRAGGMRRCSPLTTSSAPPSTMGRLSQSR